MAMANAPKTVVKTHASRRKAGADELKINVIAGSGSAKGVGKARGVGKTLQYGAVTLKVSAVDPKEWARNVELGQQALKKVKSRLVKPGVKLRTRKGVPLFSADPTNPRRVVRELDGKREVGVFENGVFKAQA
jgi:hypothetical protein